MKKTSLPNTFFKDGRVKRIFTKNLTPGTSFFEQEFLRNENGVEYREISPRHSKLGAAIVKGSQRLGIQNGSIVLYLGASHGYTPSFVSDMIDSKGLMYCVEFSPTVAKDLVFICEARENMVPLLADASRPEEYAPRITGVDVVFQDIAQRDQLGIFLKNIDMFLKPGGYGMLALKARSVDSTKRPFVIFNDIKSQIAKRKDLELVDYKELSPFEKDHAFYVIRKAGG